MNSEFYQKRFLSETSCIWLGSGDCGDPDCIACYVFDNILILGYCGTYREYTELSKDIDEMHSLGWLLNDTLYLFGQSSPIDN